MPHSPITSVDPPLTVRGLTVRAVDVPLETPLTTASGRIATAPLVLIDLETEEGVTGRSWLFAYTPMALGPAAAMAKNLEPLVAGKPLAPVALFDGLHRALTLLGAEGLVGMAISGIDMAAWDALARAANRPLWSLLGGADAPIPVYLSVGLARGAEVEALTGRARELGCRAFKVKVGHPSVAEDQDVVRTIRRAAGADADGFAIMVDYNQSLDAAEAIRRAEALADVDDVAWLEEPLAHYDFEGHAAVRAASPIPVQIGENWWGTPDMAKSLAAGASDYCMPDVMKIGGVTGWLRAAGLADGARMPMSSHVFVEASAQLLPVTPTAHYLEWLDLASPLLQEPLAIVDGCVTPPSRPGMGMEWDAAAVAKYAV